LLLFSSPSHGAGHLNQFGTNKGQNEVAGLFLTTVKRRLSEGNHSPTKAQEHGEIVKQVSSKEEGKILLVVHDIPSLFNGCMWQDTKGSWRHKQKDEKKNEEQENEEDVKRIPNKCQGIEEIEHIKDVQRYECVLKSLFSSTPIQFCCLESFGNNMTLLSLPCKTWQVTVHMDQQARKGVIRGEKSEQVRKDEVDLPRDDVRRCTCETREFPGVHGLFQSTVNFRSVAHGKSYDVLFDHVKGLFHHSVSWPCLGEHIYANKGQDGKKALCKGLTVYFPSNKVGFCDSPRYSQI
ncbi:hypothetical protein KI387_005883, partial [Taxus chinensis]